MYNQENITLMNISDYIFDTIIFHNKSFDDIIFNKKLESHTKGIHFLVIALIVFGAICFMCICNLCELYFEDRQTLRNREIRNRKKLSINQDFPPTYESAVSPPSYLDACTQLSV